jgi:hypothetical protein
MSGHVTERRPQREAPSPRQLRLKVDWCRAWLAVCHDYTFEDVKHVGVLISWTTLDSDAEEVVKRPEVLHGEFLLKSEYGTTQELCAGCGQDDIINIK